MSAPDHAVDTAAATFRRGVETGDIELSLSVVSPQVVFHSPVVHKPYEGIDALRVILSAVTQVFEDFRYTAEFSSADGHVLAFTCRVDNRSLDGVDILHVGADGLVDDFTVMVRPYSAATALRTRMAALLAAG
jgi:hypothetical protein